VARLFVRYGNNVSLMLQNFKSSFHRILIPLQDGSVVLTLDLEKWAVKLSATKFYLLGKCVQKNVGRLVPFRTQMRISNKLVHCG
jgi:hypothetical protein